MIDEKIDTYSPEIVSQKKLDIKFTDDNFDDISEGGLIKTKLNEEVIIQRIARDLYKNATSGLRELFNNAARACRIANKEYDDGAYVQVTLDGANRTLIIEDINATGISIARFKKVLLVLGTSDNLNSHEVGQFGMGFASYTTLSSAVILESKSRVQGNNGEYQNYKMVAKDGMSFQPVGKSSLEKFGTRLTMVLYEDVDVDTLIQYLRKLVRYCGIKTVLKLENYDGDEAQRGSTEIVYEAESIKDTMDMMTREFGKTIYMESDDYEFAAVVGSQGHRMGADRREVLIVGTPIDSILTFPFDNWILNIKNERKYKPMPDRDRMTEKADDELRDLMEELLTQHFDQVNIQSYDELKNSPLKSEFLWLLQTQNRTFMPENQLEFMRQLSFTVKQAAGGKDASTTSIAVALEKYDEIVYMKNNTKSAVEKMENLLDNVYCFTFTKGQKNKDWETDLEMLQGFGVRDSTEIFKEHRIKIVHEKKELGDMEIICHYNNKNLYEKGILDIEEVDEMTMMVDKGNTNDVIKILRKGYSPFKVIRNIKEFQDTDVRVWSEYIADLGNIVVATNHGAMTIESFCADSRTQFICKDFRVEFEDIANRIDDKLIMLTKDQFFGYRTYMSLHKDQDDVNTISVQDLIANVADVGLHDEKQQNYFAKVYNEIPNCHWSILAQLLSQVQSYNYNRRMDDDWDNEVLGVFDSKLLFVKGLERFSTATPYTIMKGYQAILDSIDKDSDNWNNVHRLMETKKHEIQSEEGVFMTAVKKLILPNLFADFDVRYLKYDDSSYRSKVKCTIRTKDTAMIPHQGFEVYSWHVSTEITKVVREDDYMIVSLEMTF